MIHSQALKKFFIVIISLTICVATLFLFSDRVSASKHPILYMFWGDGCPHCEKERDFLEELRLQFPELEMRVFETWNHREFAQLADALRKAYKVESSSVPITFIGKWTITGFDSPDTTGTQIIEQIEACLKDDCPDALDMAGPLNIVLKIKEEAARNQPVDWELYVPGLASQ